MLLNYLRIAFRNIKKDRVFSIINVLGLAIGITCFLALFLFIKDELSYDKFNENANQIYRVYVKVHVNGHNEINSKTAGILGQTLMQNFPEVTAYTRIGYFGPRIFRYEDKKINSGRIYGVDSNFFSVFSLQFVKGNPRTALNQPNTLVLTESTAKKFFGDENPVGKTLNANNGKNFLVTGIIKDFPNNSHFSSDFLESICTYEINQNWLDSWYTTYIVLRKGTDPVTFEKKMEKILYDYVSPSIESVLGVPLEQLLNNGNSYAFHLQPLTSIYLYSQREYGIDPNTEWGDIKTGDIAYVYIFSAVAIFILLIAVFNFMNLATAKSEKRSKEVGIRKTLGSNKMSLIGQFISEAVLMCIFSVLLSIGLLELLLPLFNNLVGKELELGLFTDFGAILSLIGFAIFVGILAGSYPAFYLSSFQPVQILKTGIGKKNRKQYVRSGLVIIQFTVSITLLIGTIIIKNQVDFLQNKDLGFKKDHLFMIYNINILGSRMEAFKQELAKNPVIYSSTNSSVMFVAGIPGNSFLYDKKTGTDPISFQYLDVDYNFVKTFQVKMHSGRFFSKEFSTDSSAVVINEAAARLLISNDNSAGYVNPIGKEVTSLDVKNNHRSYKIIGIMKDFNYESLHRNIRPLIFHLSHVRQPGNFLTIRISPNNVKNTINFIENTWKKFTVDENIAYTFIDEFLGSYLYRSEEKTGVIATVFSILAIFIACLGLFGLAAFVTEQRTKEIGIRKVLGASILEIVALLSKEFSIWVLLANIISWPVAYYIMRSWLDNFAYRTPITPWVFIISGLSALLIALVTVGIHAVKAAAANPVESLKYE